MAHFRLETVFDEETHLYSVEVYHPAESTIPKLRTKPRFASKEAALNETMALLEQGFGKSATPMKPN